MTNKYKVPPQIKVRVKSANEIGNGKKPSSADVQRATLFSILLTLS